MKQFSQLVTESYTKLEKLFQKLSQDIIEITKIITNCLNTSIKNIIINMGKVTQISSKTIETLIESQLKSFENGYSFVFCNFSRNLLWIYFPIHCTQLPRSKFLYFTILCNKHTLIFITIC
jgi:hypothetical protein